MGCGCDNGRKEQSYIPKKDVFFSTPASELVFVLCVIDAKERRDVATLHIPRMFL